MHGTRHHSPDCFPGLPPCNTRGQPLQDGEPCFLSSQCQDKLRMLQAQSPKGLRDSSQQGQLVQALQKQRLGESRKVYPNLILVIWSQTELMTLSQISIHLPCMHGMPCGGSGNLSRCPWKTHPPLTLSSHLQNGDRKKSAKPISQCRETVCAKPGKSSDESKC